MSAAPLRVVGPGRALGLPKRLESESITLHEARIDAIHRMGVKWVGHPGYRFDPRHSNNPDIYGPARADFIARIERAARLDRERNPAFAVAERIRSALQGGPK